MRIQPATLERRGVVVRPFPPDDVDEDAPVRFIPDRTLAEWIRETFIAGSGPLAIEEHAHLMDARLGVLWTNAIYVRQMRHVYATAEIPTIQAGGWRRARFECQLRDWFGEEIDFLLTFSAPDCRVLDDRGFCSLVDHELCHCAQAENEYGAPKFSRATGRPTFTLRGHDVEEFIGVTRRWGPTTPAVRALVHAAHQRPLIADADIAWACGLCAERAA